MLDFALVEQFVRMVVQRAVQQELAALGLPRLMSVGKVAAVRETPAASGKWYADVYLDGVDELAGNETPNIPVRPGVGPTLAVGDQVWVHRVNFSGVDLFVDMKRVI